MNSLDDYLSLLGHMFVEAKVGDAVCLKTTQAYERSLYFETASKEKGARAFGRSRSEMTPEEATGVRGLYYVAPLRTERKVRDSISDPHR